MIDFDFNLIKTGDYDYQFIIDNQDVFLNDMENFTHTKAFRDNSEYRLYVPFNRFHQADSCFRVYLRKMTGSKIAIPIIVDRDTKFNNFNQYSISPEFENEICCLISNSIDKIMGVYDGTHEPYEISPIKNLLFWSDLFIDNVNEAVTLNICVDENRDVNHGPRIKFQHNDSNDSTTWATMIVNEKQGFPIVNNAGETINSKEKHLIRCWVKHNQHILINLFNSKNSYSIDDFLCDYRRIDKHGDVLKEPNEIWLSNHKDVSILQFITKDVFIVNDDDFKSNILVKGKLVLNDWGSVVYNASQNNFSFKNKTGDYIINIKGKVIKKK